MAQKWYQKASVQVAMVSTIGVIVVTLITVLHQRSELRSDNKTLSRDLKKTEEALRKAEAKRDKAEMRLAPFLATANQHFQDVPEDKRLNTLSQKFDSMLATVQHGDQNILLKLKSIESAVGSLSQLQPPSGDRSLAPPMVQRLTTSLKEFSSWEVEIVCLMGDGEAHSLAEQIKTMFAKADWKVNGVNQALFSKPVRRLILKVGSPPPEAFQRGTHAAF